MIKQTLQKLHSLVLTPSIILGIAIALGRLAGFFREILLAQSMGVTVLTDVAIVLLTLPDMLVGLLLSGGLNVALVPALGRAREFAPLLFKDASLFFVSLFIFFGGFFLAFPSVWFHILAPGISFEVVNVSSWAFFAIALSFPLTALSGINTSLLNARHRFFVAGCGTLIFNLSVLLGLSLGAVYGNSINFICLGILVGAIIRWMSQQFALPKEFISWIPTIRRNSKLLPEIASDFFHGLIASFALIMVPVIIRSVASNFGPGYLSAFNYAMKLVELPLAILITTIATVAYPKFCQYHFDNHSDKFHRRFQDSLNKSWLLSLSVLIFGWPLSSVIIQLFFGNGLINQGMLFILVDLTKIALLSVPFVGINTLMICALNAKGLSKFVVQRNITSLVILLIILSFGVYEQSPQIAMLALPIFHIGLIFLFYIGNKELRLMVGWKSLFFIFFGLAIGASPIYITQFIKQDISSFYQILMALVLWPFALWISTSINSHFKFTSKNDQKTF